MQNVRFRVISLASKIYGRTAGIHSWITPAGWDTGIQVANCVAKTTVPLILPNGNIATWYTCGPTVYAPSHLGHASCYVKVDIVQRILRDYFNINLLTAMNITDIDDKIIKQCNNGIDWQDVAKEHERTFWADLNALNIAEPNIVLRVSEHIPHILKYITTLIDNRAAYVGRDKSVYFKVNQCQMYGKLQKLNLDEEVGHDVKDATVDFALWKSAKPGEPFWDSPWGRGRPGWHIECSTMASKIFGDSIDFHAGGLDLRFPHHENEEAQSCMFYGKNQWVNYWLHTGQLFVKGQQEKMSKSLHNTISIKEFLDDHNPQDFRMACILSNYSNAMAYSEELLSTAMKTRQTFTSFFLDSQAYIDGKKAHSDFDSSHIWETLSNTTDQVDVALKSNFNTSKAVGHLIQLVSKIEKSIHTSAVSSGMQRGSNVDSVIASKNFVDRMFRTFGFNTNTLESKDTTETKVTSGSAMFENLIKLRNTLRSEAKDTKNRKLFEISDKIRMSLESGGVKIKDHENGTSWQIVKK